MDSLQQTIDAAWDARSELSPTRAPTGLRDAVAHVIGELDQGRLRVADKTAGTWTTHEWIKKAVLLSFRLADNAPIGLAGPQAPFRTTTRPSRQRGFASYRPPSHGAAPSSDAMSC